MVFVTISILPFKRKFKLGISFCWQGGKFVKGHFWEDACAISMFLHISVETGGSGVSSALSYHGHATRRQRHRTTFHHGDILQVSYIGQPWLVRQFYNCWLHTIHNTQQKGHHEPSASWPPTQLRDEHEHATLWDWQSCLQKFHRQQPLHVWHTTQYNHKMMYWIRWKHTDEHNDWLFGEKGVFFCASQVAWREGRIHCRVCTIWQHLWQLLSILKGSVRHLGHAPRTGYDRMTHGWIIHMTTHHFCGISSTVHDIELRFNGSISNGNWF